MGSFGIQRCFYNCELIKDTVAVVQVNRGYFLWLCSDKSPECRGGDYTYFFFLSVQILELQKKVERENVITTKVKQANCSKWLQDQTQTLELHLNNVSKHSTEFWGQVVACTKCFLISTNGNSADAFGSYKLHKGLSSPPGLTATSVSQKLLQAW